MSAAERAGDDKYSGRASGRGRAKRDERQREVGIATVNKKKGSSITKLTAAEKAQWVGKLEQISKEWIDSTVMEVNGHMDTCDRAEHLSGVLMDEIEMMTLYLYT